MAENKTKKIILATGSSGMVGSRMAELLDKKYQFVDISLEKGIDITDLKAVEAIFQQNQETLAVLHLAALTDVDECEKQKSKGKKSLAWQINVIGTENITKLCRRYQKKLIYISTDFVFDGKNGPYQETDIPNPSNFYARTKFVGEKVVQKLLNDFLICRIAFPFRSKFTQKTDIVRTIIEKLAKSSLVEVVDNLYITPTFIDDIAYALDLLIKQNQKGIFHLVGDTCLTPKELADNIADVFGFDKNLAQPVRAETYFKNRAPRPKNSCLTNLKIKALGGKFHNIVESLQIVKKQMQNDKLKYGKNWHIK